MQNKGFVKVIAVALILVCAYYLSFTFVTSHYTNKAEEYANGDSEKYYAYLDSMANEKVWLWNYTLKECYEKEINLGLDLKGGMNVTLEVSVPDIVKALASPDAKKSENFNKALALATKKQATSQADFLTLFEQSYLEIDPNVQFATLFSTIELKSKISLNTSNKEVMKVLSEEVDAAIANSFNILRTRIDRFGVVQPNIQRLDNSGRILVELPGIKEPERVRKLLQGTANLEFWETYSLPDIVQRLDNVNNLLKTLNVAQDSTALKGDTTAVAKADTAKSAVDSLANLLNQGETKSTVNQQQNKAEAEKQNPLFAILSLNADPKTGQAYPGAVVGMAHYTDTAKINRYFNLPQVKAVLPTDLSMKWDVKAMKTKDQTNGQYVQLYAIKVNREGKAPLGGDVISTASADFGQYSSEATVSMEMNPEGANTWARLTEENIGKCIAIVLDNYVYSAPRVNDKIPGGHSQITGNFSIEEAKDLANVLKSGKMPAPARIVQEDVVGPSLGQEAIQSGFISFVIAFIVILAYMIFFYGLVPGLVADAVLIVNVFLLLGILASFKAVLTLPGIAGIVLTLAMAVDANVIIFERIREEIRAGKSTQKAVADGHKHAAPAIIDANLTTVLVGVILFVFGTGPIRGFATTLIIGIITSFTTAFILANLVFEWLFKTGKVKELAFSTKIVEKWWLNAKYDFVGFRKYGYIIVGLIVLVSGISLFTRGLNQGIDFSGGRNYTVVFDKDVNTEELKDLLRESFDGETPNVIAVKSSDADISNNRVRISTNYLIDDHSSAVDSIVEVRLYQGLKPLLKQGTTKEEFTQNNVISSQKVGPTIANDIKVAAFWAVILAILGIGLYILIRFRNVSFSVGSIASLAHDAVFVLGAYSLFYNLMPFSMEVGQDFIAAILTVVGYSINDTVVVFDRVREYRILYPKRDIKQTVNDALNSTLGRTFNTTFITVLVLFVMFLFGGDSIRGFVFALLIGVIVGAFSTLFIAAPVAYDILAKEKKKNVD